MPFQEILPTLRHTSVEFTLAAAIGNVALFVPLGALVPLRFPSFDRLARIAGLCTGISAAIELIQLPIGHHSTSTDDVILNTLGGVLGYAGMRLARVVRIRRQVKRAGATRRPG